jgi:hypothetical protein
VTLEKNIGHTNLNAFWYIDGAAVPTKRKILGENAERFYSL